MWQTCGFEGKYIKQTLATLWFFFEIILIFQIIFNKYEMILQ